MRYVRDVWLFCCRQSLQNARDDKGEDMIGHRLIRLIAFFSLTSLLLATLSPVRAAPRVASLLSHQGTSLSLDNYPLEPVSNDEPSPDLVSDVPQGVSAGWWQTVQKDIHDSEYHVKPLLPKTGEAAYQAPNRAQNLRTYFTPSGIRVVPRVTDGDPPWEWGLTLSGYGYAGDIQPVSAAELTVSTNRITYRRGALTEWYVNDENGLEQGFTLSAPPQHLHRAADAVQVSPIPNSQYPIVLELTLSGNLTPNLSDDRSAIEFTTPPSTGSGQGGGVRVLRYANLHAYDATGRPLPAHLSLSPSLSNLSISLDATDAIYPITVDPLASTPAWTAESNQAGARFGAVVETAGDVNGDGYSDIVIGARFYDDGQTDEGAIFVYHGSPTGPSTSADWMVGSNRANAEFGCSASTAGDVNGDGYDDVVAGAHHYSNGQTYEGRAYLYYGSATGLSATPAWTVESNQYAAYMGRSVSTAGDVNSDGYSDVLVGAYMYDGGQSDEGRISVYYGSDTGLNTTADWIAESNQTDGRMNTARTAGDVNGDGYSDIIVGAYHYDDGQDQEGWAFVYHGSPTGLDANGTRPSGSPANADWTAQSNQAGAQFGRCLGTAGDVNGDGYSDVIVGARYYDNGQSNEGMAFVYHGSATGLSATPNWTAEGDQAGAVFGQAVNTAGDVNGDGYADVIVGAYGYDNEQENAGRAYVYYGSSSGLQSQADWMTEGDQANAYFGISVSTAGDVNGDGYSDVIVGATRYDNGQTDEGRAFVYYGASSGPDTIADWTDESDQPGASFGFAVNTAGDVNGDGYSDIIVGARYYDNGQTDEGAVFVYHGSPAGPSASPDWSAESNQAYARMGVFVSTAGDVNRDGYADVVVGAAHYDNGQSNEGRAYVYHGSATGLSAAPDWTVESNQESAYLGHAVSTAGDVNGDGYDDVLVGAYQYSNGQAREGRVYVYYGSDTGLSATADWIAESNQAEARMGYHGSGSAGDVNGDGYSDIIVGAFRYYNDDQDGEGWVFVYHGSATGLDANGTRPSGLPTNADWTAQGDQIEAGFGLCVSTAGDVNSDGYSDVIVGAYRYDNGQTDEGMAFVYHGSPSGLEAAPAWTVESNQDAVELGWSVSTAGDVNGDGYADVVVGAYGYDNGQEDEGLVYVYHGSPTGLHVGPADWSVEGEQEGAWFGRSVGTAGDVNGDGYSDVIVGASHYSNGQEDEGRAFVYYGAASGLEAVTHWTAESNQADAQFGYAVDTAGDVNGDGYDDIVVGARYYDDGQTNEGAVFVYHGSPTGPGTSADWMVGSNQANAGLGAHVALAGDVNGDGYGDVIAGAPTFDNGQSNEGRAYVYHGSATGLSAAPDWAVEGNQVNAYMGRAVSTAGDVNADGYADVVVGAYFYDDDQIDEGRAYVYHGSATGLSTTPDWTVEGNQTDAHLGRAVGAAGDVNGDGYDDVIIGVTLYDNGQTDEGRAIVFHGSAAGLSATPDWSAESDQADAGFGLSVSTAGDVNGDGYGDVIVGAYLYDGSLTDAGGTFVYHGSATGLSLAPDWTIEGDQAEASLGRVASSAGDVNGDGYGDVIVGAPYYDNGHESEGRVYVYHGSPAGLDTGQADWVAEGDQEGARFHWSNTAGDVNGDGYDDVTIGALGYDNGETNEGRAYVYYGSPSGIRSNAAGWMVEGDQENAYLGRAVSTAGDVNGDGYADVIVGAPGYDNDQASEGRAYVYHGSAAGLSLTPDWVAEGNQPGAGFGYAVGAAGDVNGDGYGDVIIGARNYDGGQIDEGRAYVYHGSATGLETTASWNAGSDQGQAHFGHAVGTAGDVNGDGYADVVVGAEAYDDGEENEGRAYVYHGSAAGLSATAAWTVEGDQDEARLGVSVGTAGDVNGDGYSDVVVGAWLYDGDQSDEGRAYVYHGSAIGLSEAADWTAEGDQEVAYFGYAVGTAGDVNGDGYSDVIVGATCYDNDQADEGRAYVYHGSPAGLGATANWTAESDQADAHLGHAVGAAGDVNGDGFSDVIVGAEAYDDGEEDEGRAYVYHGSAAGLNTDADWVTEGDQADARYGYAVGTAGDVNGDGYADAIVGAYLYDGSETDAGQVLMYYGNGGDGLDMLPRQLRSDGLVHIAPLGTSDSPTAFQLRLTGRNPLGREKVKLQWQVAPLGTPFTATGIISGTSVGWTDTLTTGVVITQNVIGLTPGTPYHWRVRLLYRPGNRLGQPAGRWIHVPWNSWTEQDLRTLLGLAFSAPPYNVDEDAGTAAITVTLNVAAPLTVTVDYATSDGTALAGADYAAVSGTLTFSPGVASRVFAVPILDDTLEEEDETVTLTLSNPDNAAIESSNPTTLTILDDDGPPTVDWSHAAYAVDESAGTATLTVTLDAVSALTVTADYATMNSTALAGEDYAAISGTLTFSPGVTSRIVAVPILDDALDEDDETLILTLSDPINAVTGANNPATLTILDDDGPPTVDWSHAAHVVDEGAGTATLTVTLSAASALTVTADYATTNGTALAGEDYGAVSGTLAFNPGVTSRIVIVPILDDALDEDDETVILTLNNPINANIGINNPATLTILDDDDPPTVDWSHAAYAVNESAGTATLTVTLSAASGLTVTADYDTSDGTALAGEDYAAVSDTLTFSPGVTSRVFTVSILDDALEEEDETLSLTLREPSNANLGTNNPAILTILDDDGPPTVDWSHTAYAVNEDAGTATLTVTLSAASALVVTVDYASADGTALAGEDYSAVGDTLAFGPGVVSRTVTVPILDDALDEDDETVILTLRNPSNAAIGTNNPATLTILDDEAPGMSLVAVNDSPTVLGQATTLTATVTGMDEATFIWTLGDETSDVGAVVAHTYPAVGIYTATVIASGTDVLIATTVVTVSDAPIVELILSNDSPTVLGNVTTLTATITTGSNVSYTWDLGDGSTPFTMTANAGNGAVVGHTYPAADVYTAVLTASNSVSVLTATTTVVVQALPESPEHLIYLPLVAHDYAPPATFPVFIGDAIPDRSAAYQGEVFYSAPVRIPDELSPGGRFYFSSQQDAVAEVIVDDALFVLLGGSEVWSHPFSSGNAPALAIVEAPRSLLEELAGRTITVEYHDLYGSIVGASAMWLIWVP
jgi:hypothetical protein